MLLWSLSVTHFSSRRIDCTHLTRVAFLVGDHVNFGVDDGGDCLLRLLRFPFTLAYLVQTTPITQHICFSSLSEAGYLLALETRLRITRSGPHATRLRSAKFMRSMPAELPVHVRDPSFLATSALALVTHICCVTHISEEDEVGELHRMSEIHIRLRREKKERQKQN